MTGYREYRFYSPMHDSIAARLSMVDERNGEFWRVVPITSPRTYRKERELALDAIEEAIDMGAEPGEVRNGEA